MLQVIKRDGTKVPFDKNKIALAIEKLSIVVQGCTKRGWHSVLLMKLKNMLQSPKGYDNSMLLKIKCIIS